MKPFKRASPVYASGKFKPRRCPPAQRLGDDDAVRDVVLRDGDLAAVEGKLELQFGVRSSCPLADVLQVLDPHEPAVGLKDRTTLDDSLQRGAHHLGDAVLVFESGVLDVVLGERARLRQRRPYLGDHGMELFAVGLERFDSADAAVDDELPDHLRVRLTLFVDPELWLVAPYMESLGSPPRGWRDGRLK